MSVFECYLTVFSKTFLCSTRRGIFGVVIGCIYPLVKGCKAKNNFYSEWHSQYAELNLCSLAARELCQRKDVCSWVEKQRDSG